MKGMKYILLSFVLVQTIFVAFLPIPFLGLIVGFTLVPLAHLISWKELFQINFIQSFIIMIKSLPSTAFSLSLIGIFLGPELMQYISPSMIFLALLLSQGFQLFFNAIFGTILQRLFYHLLPKRLKIERLGY